MIWLVRKTDVVKFPYRVDVTDGERVLLSVLTQDAWPEGMTLSELEDHYPDADRATFKRMLEKLVKQQCLLTEGRGKKRVWRAYKSED